MVLQTSFIDHAMHFMAVTIRFQLCVLNIYDTGNLFVIDIYAWCESGGVVKRQNPATVVVGDQSQKLMLKSKT